MMRSVLVSRVRTRADSLHIRRRPDTADAVIQFHHPGNGVGVSRSRFLVIFTT